MGDLIAKYRAHTNIALIKYWGKRNRELFLPVTDSLSLTLEEFYTETQVDFTKNLEEDQFILDGEKQNAKATAKVSFFVDKFRQLAGIEQRVLVTSRNFVPTAAGLASSASAFAALATALNAALDLNLSAKELSILARQGSGSASRSLFGGFVHWHKGQGNDSHSSYAEKIAEADWDIAMLVVVLNKGIKKMSSRVAMQHTIETSPFYPLWPQEVEKDLTAIKEAIHAQDIDRLGKIAEHNAMKMHATMLSADPSFSYFEADSLLAMNLVRELRAKGFSAYFTMDAGPNVKIICPMSQTEAIRQELLNHFSDSQLVITAPGPGPKALNVD